MEAVHETTPPRGRIIPLRDAIIGLGALILPGAGFLAALIAVSGEPGYPTLLDIGTHPWELWVIGVFGIAATTCGFLDYHYHATGRRIVSKRERHGELIALALGGAPLFCLMLAASTLERPQVLLMPIILVAVFTVVVICQDEFVYHRRTCTRYESLLHRVLVFGNGTAWAAWMHWIFVRV